jgi:hypothetical protein
VKLWRGGDYELTVTGRTEIGRHYLRLHFDAGELLVQRPVHPTMWVRGWFPDGDRSHQRGYTLVNDRVRSETIESAPVGGLGRCDDRHQELLDHGPLVLVITTREDQQRGQHPDQPASLAVDVHGVFGG